MNLKSLQLVNFRNYENINLDFDCGTIVIIGENGQGKTNLLESIYYISTGKSHRTSDQDEMINWNSDSAILRALISGEEQHLIEIELRRTNKIKIRIDGSYAYRKSDFIRILPSVIFSPGDLKIVKSGPANRRDFLDDILEKIYGGFNILRLQYLKVLNQRNGLIKSMINENNPKGKLTLEVWNESLVKYGSEIMEKRQLLLDEIRNKFEYYMNYFFHDLKPEIFYQFSWNRKMAANDEYSKSCNSNDKSFYNEYQQNGVDVPGEKEKVKNMKEIFDLKLKENLKRDLNFKTTIIGPHRDDILILINGKDLRSFGSQGQQRVASICLKFSELAVIQEKLKRIPVLLLDDVLSELDLKRKKLLIDLISGKSQTFITTSNIDYLDDFNERLMDKFQVKDNSINVAGE